MESPYMFYGVDLRVEGVDVLCRSVTLEIAGQQPMLELSVLEERSMQHLDDPSGRVRYRIDIDPSTGVPFSGRQSLLAGNGRPSLVDQFGIKETRTMDLQPQTYEAVNHVAVRAGIVTIVKVCEDDHAYIGYACCCPEDAKRFEPERGHHLARTRIDILRDPSNERYPVLCHTGGRPSFEWLGDPNGADIRWLRFIKPSSNEGRTPIGGPAQRMVCIEDAIMAIGGVPACCNCGLVNPELYVRHVRTATSVLSVVQLVHPNKVLPNIVVETPQTQTLACTACGHDPNSNAKWGG